MNPKYKLSRVLLTSFSIGLLLAIPAFAERQDRGERKSEGGHGGEPRQERQAPPQRQQAAPAPAAPNVAPRGSNFRDGVRPNRESSPQVRANHPAKGSPTQTQNFQNTQRPQFTQNTQVVQNYNQRSAPAQRGQNQARYNQQYNRGNHYGGLWSSADSHRDWNRNRAYYWNRHNYRWYDGGWLIIDLGYTPTFTDSDSIPSSVQVRLTDQGYYHGPIDGDIGPSTRRAIANYQNDHGLDVTGSINDSLLRSLQLE